MNYRHLESPIGRLRLESNGTELVRIAFAEELSQGDPSSDTTTSSGEKDSGGNDPVLTAAVTQLEDYFAGRRSHFELPLAPGGTDFQRAVWQALEGIPYGELRSYRDIATAIGRPNAVRAVGAANGRNPLPIVVPCHRVIGSDGSLTGFAGGLDVKKKLLQLEGSLGAD
jgi:methylated-DNA-[protein]-cysteine S-methyltransferase